MKNYPMIGVNTPARPICADDQPAAPADTDDVSWNRPSADHHILPETAWAWPAGESTAFTRARDAQRRLDDGDYEPSTAGQVARACDVAEVNRHDGILQAVHARYTDQVMYRGEVAS